MRLLHRSSHGDLTFTDDLYDSVPAYAILSHTWGKDEEEVTFQDIKNGSGRHKEGYEKIKFCGEQAARHGLQYFWVDTCCIDKTNHVELTTAINSMYRWYQNAAKCYVYLSDVTTNGGEPHGSSWLPTFKRSRWHTRGWTLQELIAPRSVEFFSSTRTRLGDKTSLEKELHEISGVPESILQGGPLSDYNVEKQLSWMDRRQTKREEDQAYALLGLFGVYMPLIYGEGKKNALRRLNEEISKSARYRSHATNPVANILLSVDWHAFDGDPSVPLLEWRIHTPQSLYHPGTHTGRLRCKERSDIYTDRFIRVWFDSRIYSPFVRQANDGVANGATSSEGDLEDMIPPTYRLDRILQSVAHFLAYGPWYDGPESETAPFRFHEMEPRARSNDRDALARAASFWARAYTMPTPDENDFPDTPLPDECRKTTATAITELMTKHNIPVDETWDFETSLKIVKSQREWALEERKWADRLRALIFFPRSY